MRKHLLLGGILMVMTVAALAQPSVTNTTNSITMQNTGCFLTAGSYNIQYEIEDLNGVVTSYGQYPCTVTTTFGGSGPINTISIPAANLPTEAVEGYNLFGENFYLGGAGPYGTNSVIRIYSGASLSAYFTINYNQVNCFALPVHLSAFTATRIGNTIRLNWTTDYESNSSHFQIERNGTTANTVINTKVGTVAAANNSSIQTNYTFTDNYPLNGTNVYRLRMVDLDATFEFSPVRMVTCSGCTATPSLANCSGVTIDGADAICNLGATYNLSSQPNYTSVSWSITPTYVANWGGNDFGKAWIKKTGTGTATLQATLSGCTSGTGVKTKTIAVGAPSVYVQYVNTYYYSYSTNYQFSASNVPGANYYDYVWTKNGSYYTSGKDINVYAYPGDCDVYTVTVSNACGTTSSNAYACYYTPPSDPDPCGPIYPVEWKVSPVPASNTMKITFLKPPPCPIEPAVPYKVELTDIYGTSRKQMRLSNIKGEQSIDVSNLPNGIYILRITNGKSVYTKQVKILH
jgi:hypothetical protein